MNQSSIAYDWNNPGVTLEGTQLRIVGMRSLSNSVIPEEKNFSPKPIRNATQLHTLLCNATISMYYERDMESCGSLKGINMHLDAHLRM